MFGKVAAAFSRSASLDWFTAHCMFDCPEQTQTSPMSTSVKVTVFLPRTVSVCGPPYSRTGSSCTCQEPSAAATTDFDWPAKATVTSSPGSALPHTRLAMPCCSTMWSPNILLSDTSARATAMTASRAAAAAANLANMRNTPWSDIRMDPPAAEDTPAAARGTPPGERSRGNQYFSHPSGAQGIV